MIKLKRNDIKSFKNSKLTPNNIYEVTLITQYN